MTFIISISFMSLSAHAAGYNGPFYNNGDQFVVNSGIKATVTLASEDAAGNQTGEGFPTSSMGTTNLPIDYNRWESTNSKKFSANLVIHNDSGSPQTVNQMIGLSNLSATNGVYINDADKKAVISDAKTLTGKVGTVRIRVGGNLYTFHSSTDDDWNKLESDNWNSGFSIQINTPDGSHGSDLANNDSISLKIPLTVTDPNNKDFTNVTVSQFSYNGDYANPVLQPTFVKDIRNTVANKPYLVTKMLSSDPQHRIYQVLPDDAQSLVPTSTDNPIIFDPFNVGYEKAAANQATIPAFNTGVFYINNRPIFKTVSQFGWSMEYVNNNPTDNVMLPYYTYSRPNNSSDNPTSFIDEQGNPLPLIPNNYASFVSLRKVLDAKNWTIHVGDKFDPSIGFEKWTTKSSTITDFDTAVAHKLQVIQSDSNPVNTNKAGVYPVTFKVPDATFRGSNETQYVSKTVNLTVLTPNSYVLKGSTTGFSLNPAEYYVNVMYRDSANNPHTFTVNNLSAADLDIEDNNGNLNPDQMRPGQVYKVILNNSGKAKVEQAIRNVAGNVTIDSAINDAYFTYVAPAKNTVVASLTGSSNNKNALDPSDYKVTFTGDPTHAAYTPVNGDLQLEDDDGNAVTKPVAGEQYNVALTTAGKNRIATFFDKSVHLIFSGKGVFIKPVPGVTPTPTPSTNDGSSTNGSPSTPIGPATPSKPNSGNNSTTTTTKPSTSVGPNIAVKGEAVYATKKIGLYKNTKFTKANRIAWYPKQKRVNRPMFVVTGYKRAANGALKYKVRDVNHGRKTAGKKGYITASRKYVVPVYYASVPKSKKITVISPKGINTYKSANLTGKAKHYKKGVRLTVKKLVKHNLTTRYQLSNGYYVTANKKLIIQGNY